MRDRYDRTSKWLIQHHGDSVLRLGGAGAIRSWRALQADLVQPRRLPDGLLEVTLADETDADLFLIEVATYPEERVPEQLVRDLALVFLDRGLLPEVLTLVLRPRGNQSRRAGTRLGGIAQPSRLVAAPGGLARGRVVDGAGRTAPGSQRRGANSLSCRSRNRRTHPRPSCTSAAVSLTNRRRRTNMQTSWRSRKS